MGARLVDVDAPGLSHPQLIAVSAAANRAKGDADPAEWKPANERSWCTFAREWIHVKYVYDLTLDRDEKSALHRMLDHC